MDWIIHQQHCKVWISKFSHVPWQICIGVPWWYICILEELEEHVVHMNKILKMLRKYWLYAKLFKCFVNINCIWVMSWAMMGLKLIHLKLKLSWNGLRLVMLGNCAHLWGYNNFFRHDSMYIWMVECQEAFEKVK